MNIRTEKQDLIAIVKKRLESLYSTIFNDRHFLPLVGIVAAASIFSAACGGSKTSGKTVAANADQPKTIETNVVPATAKEMPKFIQATGSFLADETTEVAPETAGRVESVFVGEGDFVAANSVIIKLSELDARLRLEQSCAAEMQAKAQIRQAEAQVRQTQAQLGLERGAAFTANDVPAVREARAALASSESDLRLARANERRYANLLDTGDTSKLVYDQRRNELEKAQTAVNEAVERLRSSENAARGNNQGIEAVRANLENSQAALESARAATALTEKTVRDTTIRAPFAGFVSARSAAAGEYVSPNASVVTIVRTNPIKLRLNVPETEAGAIRIGMTVSASVATFADRNFAGRVSAINPNLDETARSLLVEAIFENPDNLLRPGMFAGARILLPGGETGVYIPRAALIKNPNSDSVGVYVVENETARLRVVQTDENSPPESEEIRILSGIAADEKVAHGNTAQLFDGAKVAARN